MPQTRKRTRQQTGTAANAGAHGAAVTTQSDADVLPHSERSQQDDTSERTAGNSDECSDDDDSEEDEEEADEEILSEQYDGPTDSTGRPHGSGTLTVNFQRGRRRGRNTFTGSFTHGVKSGVGRWQFDLGGPTESSLAGSFINDALEGEGKYVDSDGSYTVGQYKAGSLNGHAEEYTADGQLLYGGDYRDNERHGRGVLHHTDGGSFEGEWQHGLFDGTANTYTYPVIGGTVIQFRGEWRDGSMVATHLYIDNHQVGDTTYADDESTLGSPIASQPLLPDPYEAHTVYVAPSSLGPHAGEGLFARIDLPAGVCVSFYNGVKQSEAETEARHWRHNGNCIALDEAAGIDIDVPQPLATTDVYCASLGHKANHTFDKRRQNAEYGHYYHLRQGHIKCVRVRKDVEGGVVKAGEELLVEYGYDKRGGPQWWKEGKRLWKAEEAAREIKEGKVNDIKQPTDMKKRRGKSKRK